MIYYNVAIGKCENMAKLFCRDESEWENFKTEVLFTEERYLPQILVDCGIAKSTEEVVKRKPDYNRTLDKPDFAVVKWGKRWVSIQVGE